MSGKETEHGEPSLEEHIGSNAYAELGAELGSEKDDLNKEAHPPEGWLNPTTLSNEIGTSHQTLKRQVEMFRESNPEWFHDYAHPVVGRKMEYYAPELCDQMRELFRAMEPAPDGWTTQRALSTELGVTEKVVRSRADAQRGAHPNWLKKYIAASGGQYTEHYSPELVAIITQEISSREEAPAGWKPNRPLAEELGWSVFVVTKLANKYRQQHPEWFRVYTHPTIARELEYYSPELCELIEKELSQHESAPEGWTTAPQHMAEFNIGRPTVRKFAEQFRSEHPEWLKMYLTARDNKLVEHYSPELSELIRSEFGSREKVPDGWMSIGALSKALGVMDNTLMRLIDENKVGHDDWVRDFYAEGKGGGKLGMYVHPELCEILLEELASRELAPEGWMTNKGLATELGVNQEIPLRYANSVREEHPDWFQSYYSKSGHKYMYYSPELCQAIRELVSTQVEAPEGWMRMSEFVAETGIGEETIKKALRLHIEGHPDWIKPYKASNNYVYDHLSPELLNVLRQEFARYEKPPEGWMTVGDLMRELGVHYTKITGIASKYEEAHPEWMKDYAFSGTRTSLHYSPELVALIRSEIHEEQADAESLTEAQKLRESLQDYLKEQQAGSGNGAHELYDLIGLLGAGNAVDILYQIHPEYRNLPVPYVRSMLADYLGEFMTMKGAFSLDKVRENADYLHDPDLQNSLTIIVKKDFLAFYNKLKQAHPLEKDAAIIELYATNLRNKTSDIHNEDLNAVIASVEDYYRGIFANIEKPDQLRDELSAGRAFPDINQRINIQEISDKKRMLIADEPGVGKSGSAIIAKETLGVKRALIVAPSNVIKTWQDYLSDMPPAEDGKSRGYFKQGEAPNVLTITSIEDLDPATAENYGYMLISQERLDEEYTAALKAMGYDMLIADEIHKLKNITQGKRAEQLIDLSENIEGEDQYLALLSGTPVPNKVSDVAMLLKLLHPERFERVANQELVNQVINGDLLDLRVLLEDRMQMKSLAESIEMPKLQERERRFTLSDKEKAFYEVLLDEDELTAGEKMQLLRQFVLNPVLLEASPDLVGSKARIIGEDLATAFTSSDKVVMFVNGYVDGVIRGENTVFRGMDLPDDVEVATIDGNVSTARRQEIQEELSIPGKRMLLAVSGQTADTGVDFSAADEVFFYNEPWTEYDKRQELGRVWRPGLGHDLKSTTYYAEGTIEEGIHRYIKTKYDAVEKLLHGVPLSEIEQNLLRADEKQDGSNLEVNPELAEYYFSSWDRMMKIYGYTKEIGEERFIDFVGEYGRDYAEAYTDLGSRSYQANASRLSGTFISSFVKASGKAASDIRVLDVASGPEMLRNHISDDIANNVYSVDINRHHFEAEGQLRTVGSFKSLPIADASMDYANLSMALHYSNFVPSKGRYERLEVIQELNRVLVPGGRVVISLMYALDLRDEAMFKETIAKCGFEVIEDYSGQTTSGDAFKARVITLQKTADCEQDTKALIETIGPAGLQGLKFTRVKTGLKDSRKIATEFELNGDAVEVDFNSADQRVYLEEQGLTQQLEALRDTYGDVRAIPEDALMRGGYSRIYNGKKHILFKRLETANGAVVVR